ncbi:phosphatase [Clostridium aciditolerans]|uniref:Phosphatase n=1 Tax=Clostridium aciditolerans TaxID=339861 RepID=A0A934HWF1_9CLOT|nr:phosphatase [Clostridium aciditolerans]MBI6873229.1 phosphatase [Clostridium aciditolerans]
MKYILDAHTHTVASGHAYTTWLENVKEASNNGIKILATTDHGPKMPGGPHIFHFNNLKVLPRELFGVIILRGCEANILDFKGNLDIPEKTQKRLDVIIASLHDVCIKPGNKDENTEALLNVMNNENVHIIGHPGNPAFPIWEEEVIKKAKDKDILIEINNGSFNSRRGSEENCLRIAELCKKHGVNLILGSDAHTCFQIGKFPKVEQVLRMAGVTEDLIMNVDETKFIKYLKKKGKLQDINLD